MPEPVPRAMPENPLAAALALLDPALAAVADALARLPPQEWRALEREEFSHTHGCLEFWRAFGIPDGRMIPERTLGHRIIEIFAARYPHLARDERAG